MTRESNMGCGLWQQPMFETCMGKAKSDRKAGELRFHEGKDNRKGIRTQACKHDVLKNMQECLLKDNGVQNIAIIKGDWAPNH